MTEFERECAEMVSRAFPAKKERRAREEAAALREREAYRLFRMVTPRQQQLIIELLAEMALK